MNKDLLDWIWKHSKVRGRDLPVPLALGYKANMIGEATIKVAELAKLCRC